jgi:hypothetical protein
MSGALGMRFVDFGQYLAGSTWRHCCRPVTAQGKTAAVRGEVEIDHKNARL